MQYLANYLVNYAKIRTFNQIIIFKNHIIQIGKTLEKGVLCVQNNIQ